MAAVRADPAALRPCRSAGHALGPCIGSPGAWRASICLAQLSFVGCDARPKPLSRRTGHTRASPGHRFEGRRWGLQHASCDAALERILQVGPPIHFLRCMRLLLPKWPVSVEDDGSLRVTVDPDVNLVRQLFVCLRAWWVWTSSLAV